MTKRDELIALDPAGLEAAVRECARITAPEISDVEYERIKADNSPRYQNTRAEMERTLRAYLNAARSQPNVHPSSTRSDELDDRERDYALYGLREEDLP